MNRQIFSEFTEAAVKLEIAIREVIADPETHNQVNKALSEQSDLSLESIRQSLSFIYGEQYQALIRESHK